MKNKYKGKKFFENSEEVKINSPEIQELEKQLESGEFSDEIKNALEIVNNNNKEVSSADLSIVEKIDFKDLVTQTKNNLHKKLKELASKKPNEENLMNVAIADDELEEIQAEASEAFYAIMNKFINGDFSFKDMSSLASSASAFLNIKKECHQTKYEKLFKTQQLSLAKQRLELASKKSDKVDPNIIVATDDNEKPEESIEFNPDEFLS